jgi:hypothetical protein
MQPLGSTLLEVLNYGFPLVKDEKALLYTGLCIIIFIISASSDTSANIPPQVKL